MKRTRKQNITVGVVIISTLVITSWIRSTVGNVVKPVEGLCEIPTSGFVRDVRGKVTQIREGELSTDTVRIEETGTNCGVDLILGKNLSWRSGIKVGQFILVSGEATEYGVVIRSKNEIIINPASNLDELNNNQIIVIEQEIDKNDIEKGAPGVYVVAARGGGWLKMTGDLRNKVNGYRKYKITATDSMDVIDIEPISSIIPTY